MMLGPDDRLTKILFVSYCAVALYYGWSSAHPESIPVSILRGAFWPVTVIIDWARQGYVPA